MDFFALPEETRIQIYLFDPTKKEVFDKTIHQLNFILVMSQLQVRSFVFRNFGGEEWFRYYFYQYYWAKEEGFVEEEENVRDLVWARFCRKFLRKIG